MQSLEAAGCTVNNGNAFFDTITVDTTPLGLSANDIVSDARNAGINIRKVGAHSVAVAFDETADEGDLIALLKAFNLPATRERTCWFGFHGPLAGPAVTVVPPFLACFPASSPACLVLMNTCAALLSLSRAVRLCDSRVAVSPCLLVRSLG